MGAIGTFMAAVFLLLFILFMALFAFHRIYVMRRLINKMYKKSLTDPDFDYQYYSQFLKP